MLSFPAVLSDHAVMLMVNPYPIIRKRLPGTP